MALSVAVYNHYKRIYFGADAAMWNCSKSNVLHARPHRRRQDAALAQTLAKMLERALRHRGRHDA